jgi:uncharacterized protein (TIGR03905 family)
METFTYTPVGVCSLKMIFQIDNNIIKDIKIIGGCPGNTVGVSVLCKDKSIDEVIEKLHGIKCGAKDTSCPDQIAEALIAYKNSKS